MNCVLQDTGQVHMVLGGAGGTRIPTSVVQGKGKNMQHYT